MSVTKISDFQTKNEVSPNGYFVYVENDKTYRVTVDSLSSLNILSRKTFYENAVPGLEITVPDSADTTIFLQAFNSVSSVKIYLPDGFDGQSVLIVAKNLPSQDTITCTVYFPYGGFSVVNVDSGNPYIIQYVKPENAWITI